MRYQLYDRFLNKVVKTFASLGEAGLYLAQEVEQEYGSQLLPNLTGEYSAVLLSVAHNEFKDVDIRSLAPEPGVIYDVKGMLDKDAVDGRL